VARESIAPDRVNYNNPHMKDLCSSSEVVVPQVGWSTLPSIGWRAALKIVARASRPLSRGHPARARERDAPATAGETPAPHPSTVGPFFVVSGCPSADEQERLLWNRHFHPFHVYTEMKRREKLNYLHNNPVKRGWVKEPGDWPWPSWRFYFLRDASLLAMDRVP
jgi:hypothetical protein